MIVDNFVTYTSNISIIYLKGTCNDGGDTKVGNVDENYEADEKPKKGIGLNVIVFDIEIVNRTVFNYNAFRLMKGIVGNYVQDMICENVVSNGCYVNFKVTRDRTLNSF